jgi:hypothetical protein
MPDYSELMQAVGDDFDPEHSGGRFNPRVAVAVVVPEADWVEYGEGEEAIARAAEAQAGEWLLEEDDQLGEPHAVNGSIGRGAEGWVPVVEWLVNAIGEGVIDLVMAGAAAAVLRRLRRRGADGAECERQPPSFYISRGMAAAVAADDVANSFGDRGPLEVEAVEEPSSIAGVPAIETSYVGLEPWVVLLRNVAAERRYYVIVAPNGEIMGRIVTPFLEWEKGYLRPVQGG